MTKYISAAEVEAEKAEKLGREVLLMAEEAYKMWLRGSDEPLNVRLPIEGVNFNMTVKVGNPNAK